MNSAHETVVAFWAAANSRDWDAFGALLAVDVVYDLPQTRERSRGRDRYLRFNIEYPGDWHADLVRVIAAGQHATSWITMTVGAEQVPALSYFDLDDDHLIRYITDFWPEPYEPPAGREHLTERY